MKRRPVQRAMVALLLLTACSVAGEPSGPPAPEAPVREVVEVATGEAVEVVEDLGEEARIVAAQLLGETPRRARRASERRPLLPSDPPLVNLGKRREGPDLSDADFQRTIGSWNGFKSCVRRSAHRSASEGKLLKVAMEIDRAGRVVSSRVVDGRVSPALAECFEQETKKLRFPALTYAESVTREATFVF